jgi:hypothetical protein
MAARSPSGEQRMPTNRLMDDAALSAGRLPATSCACLFRSCRVETRRGEERKEVGTRVWSNAIGHSVLFALMSMCNRSIQMDGQPSSGLFLTQVVTEIEGPSLGCFKIHVKTGDRVVFLLWAELVFHFGSNLC